MLKGLELTDTHRLLSFGPFELNLEMEEIRNSGTLVRLPPQPFRLLVLLASRSGQVVTRDEIQQRLWGNDTFIDFEQGVNKCIKQIRGILNDSPDAPTYIETVPRRGYRFLAPVRAKTVLAPPPQVREASSSLMPTVVEQVRARVKAAEQASVASAPPENPPAQAVASESLAVEAHPNRGWILWAVLGTAVVAMLIVYLLVAHGR